jgi:hypothetical protein
MIIIPNFSQGDSVTWETTLLELYSDGFTLSWAIRGESLLTVEATQTTTPSTSFSTSITSTQSANLVPGLYRWVAAVSKEDQRITLANGQLRVGVDLFTTVDPIDGRTSTEKMLDQVNAAISEIINNGAVASYKIKEREFTKQDLGELIVWRDKLRIEVKREQSLTKIQQGLPDTRIIHARFNRF